MENINDIIASLTPEDIQSLKETAQAIFGNEESFSSTSTDFPPPPAGFDFSSAFNPDMFANIGRIMALMHNDSGKRCKLIEALKPNLSRERQRKADEAIQILKLLEIMPVIAEFTKKR